MTIILTIGLVHFAWFISGMQIDYLMSKKFYDELVMAKQEDAINEALNRLNGYWANDWHICESVADKYGYDRISFTKKVYEQVKILEQ